MKYQSELNNQISGELSQKKMRLYQDYQDDIIQDVSKKGKK